MTDLLLLLIPLVENQLGIWNHLLAVVAVVEVGVGY